MGKINIPKITLRKPERFWLEKLYEKRFETTEYKKIRASLYKEVPINFDPKTIDKRLAKFGTEITLLGILTINPKSDIVKKTNKVILAAKNLLLKNPEIEHIDSSKIAQITKISEKEVGLTLKLASEYGRFFRSASYSNEYNGFSRLDLSRDEEIFNQYISFSSIEEILKRYYQEEEEREQLNKKEKSTHKENTGSPNPNYDLKINPIFKSVVTRIDPKLCFVLMPFNEGWSHRVYTKYIRENIEALDLQCVRADELNGQIIIEDIWTKINQAAFIIADVTNRNANVMYELGIAHTIGKPTILITQDIKNIPFDFTHLRHYDYRDNIEGKERFDAQIKKAIHQIYNEHYLDINLPKGPPEKPKPIKKSNRQIAKK